MKRVFVYSVYSFTAAHSGDGLFGIYAGTEAKELPVLMPVVIDEIKKICNEKVTSKEFDRAKMQLKASIKMGLESSSSTAEILARQNLIYNRSLSIKEIVEKIDNATVDDIQKIAQEIFSSDPTYTLLGAVDKHMEYDELQKALS
jgi:predicted Zn-dependent peptidase